jgi:hypothetical protein
MMAERYTISCNNCVNEGKSWQRTVVGNDLEPGDYRLIDLTRDTSAIMTHHNTVRIPPPSSQGHFSFYLDGEKHYGTLNVATGIQSISIYKK